MSLRVLRGSCLLSGKPEAALSLRKPTGRHAGRITPVYGLGRVAERGIELEW
jgi:hypothetical protein